jgi:pilus assembly protein Flp/PilA
MPRVKGRLIMKWLAGIQRLLLNQQGASIIEYGFLVALIALVVAASLGPLGTAVAGIFTMVSGQL